MTGTTWLAGVCAMLMTVLSFFGTHALFGPLQLVSGLFLLAVIGLLLADAFSGVRGLFAGQGPRVLLRALGTCLLLAVVLGVQPTVHELGLRSLIALQRGALETAAQEALATAKDDENLWRPAFEIWPALLGPTRAAAWREGELLLLDFEGSPDAAVGLCYNPRHLQHKDCGTPLGGPWYRYHS
ncbi:hypothetical protein [Pelomonas sp. BJYL3]|uniref:hypothetical protein n=1 Tax=Pelomonas sp. BJYL3 TaxID=2976697 RepID=UPI0022B3407B|nr:hypothetical protein [Pelomonas sp. BJYL3]